MTKTLKGITAAVALLSAGSLFANIAVFNRSLPNQAGVNFGYVVDTWDFNTVAGYYAQSKGDNFSMTYGATELNGTGDTGEAAVSGRLTVGLPLFYAVAQRNAGNSKSDNTPRANYELVNNNSRTTVQLGTAFGNLGVALFADMQDNSYEWTNSTTGLGFTADGDSVKATNTQNKFGINLGQSTEGFASAWTLGASYTKVGDEVVTKDTVTTTNSGTTNTRDGNGSIIDVATSGWMPLGADFWGWSATFSTGSFENEAKTKTSGMSYMVNPFYTKTLAIKDGSNLYLNPGLAVYGSSSTSKPATGDQTDASFTGLYLTLPIMFQVPVTESGSFTVQAGVSPKVALWTTGDVSKTGNVEKVTTNASQGMFSTAGLSYGFGASYKPSEKLSMHALLNTTANEVDTKFALGVDYHFGTVAAAVQE